MAVFDVNQRKGLTLQVDRIEDFSMVKNNRKRVITLERLESSPAVPEANPLRDNEDSFGYKNSQLSKNGSSLNPFPYAD